MAGMALKGQCNLVFIMVPSEVSVKENFSQQNIKNNIYCSKVDSNAASFILLMDASITAFRNLIIYI